MTDAKLKVSLDISLNLTTTRVGGAPGVVAMATDKPGSFYEGASGARIPNFHGPNSKVHLRHKKH
jgi:methyl acetate hydrolase